MYEGVAGIGLGSNLGNRLKNLRWALYLLSEIDVTIKKLSCVYETEAILPEGSPSSWNIPYLNAVVHIVTTLAPRALHKKIKNLETKMGRVPKAPKWSPRIIDYDLLFYENFVIHSDSLQIPHPHFLERFFTLVPATQLFPYWKYPDPNHQWFGKNLLELSKQCLSKPACFKRSLVLEPKLVGVVNITPDSFSDGNQFFDTEKALSQIVDLSDAGASVIELGAQSTRPGSFQISSELEWERLSPILEALEPLSKEKQLEISLDSYSFDVIQRAVAKYTIHFINDVSGSCDAKTLDLVARNRIKIVLMHSLGVPPTSGSTLSSKEHPIESLIKWGEAMISTCLKRGLSQQQILLDPGIGFGKLAFQSWQILSDINALKDLGCEIFVGHSRKSFFKWCTPMPPEERDWETAAISLLLSQKKVGYLRVHNVEKHQRLLTAAQLMEGPL